MESGASKTSETTEGMTMKFLLDVNMVMEARNKILTKPAFSVTDQNLKEYDFW